MAREGLLSSQADSGGFIKIPSKQQSMRKFKSKYRHLKAFEHRLGEILFRIGFPYLLRHSVADEEDEEQLLGTGVSPST